MKFCPLCGGDLAAYLAVEASGARLAPSAPALVVQKKYNQTNTWKRLMEQARQIAADPPDLAVLGLTAAETLTPLLEKGPVSTIVHMVFDRAVVPQGGMLLQAAMHHGEVGSYSEGKFAVRGYAMEDGKIQLVNDTPVGPIYSVLDYWGGDKQHRRWHLSEPVTIDPSRNGEPFFMDDNMLAFGAKWKDAERLDEALITLLGLLDSGVQRGEGNAQPVARPIALELVAQPS